MLLSSLNIPRFLSPYVILTNLISIHSSLQEFFIATNPKGMEPMKLHGRILPPPTIEFGGGRADVRAGAWNMNRGVHRFIQPTSIPSAITIVNDARSQSNVVQFIQAMFRGLEALGMNTSAVAQKPLVFARKYGQRVEQAMDEAIQEAGYTFGKAPAVILWVFERPNDSDYNTFKVCILLFFFFTLLIWLFFGVSGLWLA